MHEHTRLARQVYQSAATQTVCKPYYTQNLGHLSAEFGSLITQETENFVQSLIYLVRKL